MKRPHPPRAGRTFPAPIPPTGRATLSPALHCIACRHAFDRRQKIAASELHNCLSCAAAAIKRHITATAFRLAGSGCPGKRRVQNVFDYAHAGRRASTGRVRRQQRGAIAGAGQALGCDGAARPATVGR
ncbi:MAG: FmdB family zinc ribbon protein [Stenotrophomonas sp.]